MGSQRRGKKQKQGPRTLSKEEATGRVSKNVLESRERTRQEMSLLSNPLLAAAPLLASIRPIKRTIEADRMMDDEGRHIINADTDIEDTQKIIDEVKREQIVKDEQRNKSQYRSH